MGRKPRVAIVGAGMSGICMGVKLRECGFDDFTIYEKARGPGGTWRQNRYPGLTCDVPSRFYQFSFAPNPSWSSFFSTGPEINDYLGRVVAAWGLAGHIRYGSEVIETVFDDGRWLVTTAGGEQAEYDFLICATGFLDHPRLPELRGLDDFAGFSFHSARWDHSAELAGKRVGVIGTGSTGVQMVTALAGVAAHLDLFQRTAQWVVPVPNFGYSRVSAALHRAFPILNRLSYYGIRFVIEFFSQALVKPGWRRRAVDLVCWLNLRTVRDRQLRRALRPNYRPMCKRLVVSSGFYRAVQRSDVSVVTAAIDRVVPSGVATADGALHELDVLILATGFDAHAFMRPMKMSGRDGITLEEAWAKGPSAFQTVAMPGFPNCFTLVGPHSPIGNFSVISTAETQVSHVMGWIRRWSAGEFATVEPSRDATSRYNSSIRAALPRTVWVTGCNSWYLGADGLPELWPWTPHRHRTMLANPARSDWVLV
jgi:cation diffusion facilitator CzcD-associated flavoprotein CzcO